jgi:hypothetical protein
MKLLTKAIERKFEKTPMSAVEDIFDPRTVKVIVKYFDPCGSATWYVIAAEKWGDSWLMYGLADLGLGCAELGDIPLNELEGLTGQFGLGMERDLSFDGTLNDAMLLHGHFGAIREECA